MLQQFLYLSLKLRGNFIVVRFNDYPRPIVITLHSLNRILAFPMSPVLKRVFYWREHSLAGRSWVHWEKTRRGSYHFGTAGFYLWTALTLALDMNAADCMRFWWGVYYPFWVQMNLKGCLFMSFVWLIKMCCAYCWSWVVGILIQRHSYLCRLFEAYRV